MKYYKNMDNSYIQCLSTGAGQMEITEAEYLQIISICKNKPADTADYYYRLTDALLWEKQPRIRAEDAENLSAEDALNIITGGVT